MPKPGMPIKEVSLKYHPLSHKYICLYTKINQNTYSHIIKTMYILIYFLQCVKHINGIYSHCAKTLSAKTGAVARNVTDTGALMPSFDRPEQGLDLIQDAMTTLELTPGDDFHISINCAGHEIFDYVSQNFSILSILVIFHYIIKCEFEHS